MYIDINSKKKKDTAGLVQFRDSFGKAQLLHAEWYV